MYEIVYEITRIEKKNEMFPETKQKQCKDEIVLSNFLYSARVNIYVVSSAMITSLAFYLSTEKKEKRKLCRGRCLNKNCIIESYVERFVIEERVKFHR